MKKLLLFEKVFTVVSLIHYSGAPLVLILTGGASEGEEGGGGDFFLIQVIFLVIYFITFCLLILRWKKVIKVIPQAQFLWLLILLAIFSISWSAVPNITINRCIALIGTMMFPIYLASRYSLKEQLELLGWVFGIAIVGGFLFVLVMPSYGLMGGRHWGTLRGMYNHKNVLGKVMAPSVIVFFLLAIKSQKNSRLYWAGFYTSILQIILSKSSTALINMIIMGVELFLIRILRWRYDFMISTIIGTSTISTILYTLVTANAEAITALFGKDLTFSGRTNFWPLVLDKIWESPWVGYGFGAFWQGYDGPSSYIWYAVSFKAPNSHNGYLDLCAELGFVGLSIYLIEFAINFQKALFYVREVKTPEGFWPIIYLTYIILCNLTESTLIIQNNFFFVLQITIFFSMSKPEVPEKLHESSTKIYE